MSKVIHCYAISIERINSEEILKLKLHIGAKILHVSQQIEDVRIWAEVDSDVAEEVRHFEVFMTGQEIPQDIGIERRYLGTAISDGGLYVLHIYERHEVPHEQNS